VNAVKYPHVKVRLVGEDGNTFAILARVSRALLRAGVSGDDVAAFKTEALSGDYNHALATVMEWVDTD
jgi:hypothetical protein